MGLLLGVRDHLRPKKEDCVSAFMEEGLKVGQEDHLFPTLLGSMVRVFLKHSWPFTTLPTLSTPYRGGGQPLALISQFSFTFSLSSRSLGRDGCAEVQPGGRADGQSLLAFALDYALPTWSLYSQKWYLASCSFISQLVRTLTGNKGALYWGTTDLNKETGFTGFIPVEAVELNS